MEIKLFIIIKSIYSCKTLTELKSCVRYCSSSNVRGVYIVQAITGSEYIIFTTNDHRGIANIRSVILLNPGRVIYTT